jgi:hypothetical protein
MTIKEILEKVDLFNITPMEEDKDVKEEPVKDADETFKVREDGYPGPVGWLKKGLCF